MADEATKPLPLTGDEVREAIIFRVDESLSKTCHLRHDDSYSSFSAEISIKIRLNDFGREQKDNHLVSIVLPSAADLDADAAEKKARELTANLAIEPAPPNQVRVDTGQDVPVKTTQDGKTVVKHVKYAARKPKIQPKTAMPLRADG
jgi:hypothetical protein